MRIILNIYLFICFIECWGNLSVQYYGSGDKNIKDTAYVLIDSFSINKKENTFELVLVYQQGKQTYEICREKNRDYSIEFQFNFSYSKIDINYLCFTVNDLPTGARWDVIFNKKTKIFYRTEVYDVKALGDVLVDSSVNFNYHTALIKNNDVTTSTSYTVKLIEIWKPTEEYKIKTLRKIK